MASNVNNIITAAISAEDSSPPSILTQIIQDAPKTGVSLTRMRDSHEHPHAHPARCSTPSQSPTGWAAATGLKQTTKMKWCSG